MVDYCRSLVSSLLFKLISVNGEIPKSDMIIVVMQSLAFNRAIATDLTEEELSPFHQPA